MMLIPSLNRAVVKAENQRQRRCRRIEVTGWLQTKLSNQKARDIETLMQRVNTMEMCSFIERDISISEDIVLDKSMPTIDKVVFMNITPQISDARCDGSRIYIKGYADVEILKASKTCLGSRFNTIWHGNSAPKIIN